MAVALLAAATATAAGVDFQLGKPVLDTKGGTATMVVKVPAKGKVQITTAKNLVHTKVFFEGPGSAKLPIRARHGKPVKQLRANGKLRVRFTVSYVPQGPNQPPGGPSDKVRTLTLRLDR